MNDEITDKISNVLKQVRLLKNKYDKLAAVTGEHFNIFSILRIKRKEVITHTPILAELLNPHGLHHQGAAFLKLFLEICIKDQEYTNPETFRVRSEERTDQGQFDIILEKEKEACIIIENKIYAGDQKGQLYRYYQDVSDRGYLDEQIKLVYLTLDGSPPSKESLGSLPEKSVKCLSYSKHIINWLEECMKLQEVQRVSPIREIVFQYRDLLKQLTGQSTNTRYSMELTKLLTNDKNYELIPHLEQALLELKVQTQLKFWEELANILPKKIDKSGIHDNQGKEASEDNIRRYYTGSKNRLYLGTTFRLESFIVEQTEIALRVQLDQRGCIGYCFVLFNKDGINVESCDAKIFDTLAEKLPDNDFDRTKTWFGWKWPERDLGFPVEYSESNLFLLDDSKRRKAIGEFVTEIAAAVNQLKENLN